MTPKIWLFLSKLFFTCPKEPTSGKMNFFLKNLYISIVRGLWAEIEQKLSEKKIQQSCQKCIMGVRMDIFRLIALLDFIFMLNVYRLSAKVSRAFVRRKSASSQIYNLCVLRKFLKAFFIVFFKNVFSFERNFSRKYNLRIRRNNLIFFGVCRVLKLTRFRLNEVSLLAHKLSRLSKLQTTCLEEVLIVFFVMIGLFGSQIFRILSEFFCILAKKTRRVVKRAHYVSGGGGGGAFQCLLFSKEIISENSGKNSRKTWHLFQKNSSLCQNRFLRFLWNICIEEKNSR